ncbi:OLC1v1037651C1 [Oldenlandia corymbosa var. corymbosa]|uniref:OLC1v1037651C1 n=1 Tax=Oldenlandia corymbosa var. corymbosa TaxID=529605 RepID=A0AAV1D028_OLDCO|nr:OLC1v1037651C1 [Oldenlandia corymbosa var. corymbosa]
MLAQLDWSWFIELFSESFNAIPYISAAGFGGKLLGVCGNGMVQSFINARTLTPSAPGLNFNDVDKKKMYGMISFEEIDTEVSELKFMLILSGNLMLNDYEGTSFLVSFFFLDVLSLFLPVDIHYPIP